MSSPSLFYFGDGIGAFDLRQGRISLFNGDGTHSQTVLPDERVLWVAGALATSAIVGSASGPSANHALYIRYAPNGTVLDTIGSMDGIAPIVLQWTAADGISHSLGSLCTPRPFATTIGSTLYLAHSSSGYVSSISSAGSERRIHEVQNRATLSQEYLEGLRRMYNAQNVPEEVASEALAKFGEAGGPQPSAWDRIVPDQDGRLWLRISDCARAPEAPHLWEVVDAERGYLGSVSIPSDYSLNAVRGSIGVAYSYDSLDVASVAILRMPIPD